MSWVEDMLVGRATSVAVCRHVTWGLMGNTGKPWYQLTRIEVFEAGHPSIDTVLGYEMRWLLSIVRRPRRYPLETLLSERNWVCTGSFSMQRKAYGDSTQPSKNISPTAFKHARSLVVSKVVQSSRWHPATYAGLPFLWRDTIESQFQCYIFGNSWENISKIMQRLGTSASWCRSCFLHLGKEGMGTYIPGCGILHTKGIRLYSLVWKGGEHPPFQWAHAVACA